MAEILQLLQEYYLWLKLYLVNTISPTLSTQLKSHLSPATLMKFNSVVAQIEANTPRLLTNLMEDFDLPKHLNTSPLILCIASIIFNPVFWNIAARAQYKTRILSTLALGNRYLGCYFLAITIFSLGILRDHLFLAVLRDPAVPVSSTITNFGSRVTLGGIDFMPHQLAGAALVVFGNVLVVSSMWALGVTGTYLGDYFGILMSHRVASFPFNVTDNPMYYGSFLSFLGSALWFGKPIAVALSGGVLVMYLIALRFEEPYTAEIYARRDREQKKVGNKKHI